MSALQHYQDTVLALVQGRVSAEQSAIALFGAADERTVARLRGYRDSHLLGQVEGLQIQHPEVWRVIEARLGRDAWIAVVEGFLAAHPVSHPHRLVAFAPFAAYLATRQELPPWLPDLARLQRAALLADLAPDTCSVRIEPVTSVTAVTHDILGWNADGSPDLLADPEPRECLVLTWRGPDGEPLQAEIGQLERLVVERLLEGRLPTEAELAALGLGAAELAEALEELARIGVIGAPAAG